MNEFAYMCRPNHLRMTKEETSEVEEAQPGSEFISPVHEPRKKPIVHPSAQAPLPKDYGGFLNYQSYLPKNIPETTNT